MKRLFFLLMVLGSAGCSNAPLAGTLDALKPSKPNMNTGRTTPPEREGAPLLLDGPPPPR